MPLPLAPIATTALRYGSVALAAYAVARSLPAGRRDQRIEDGLDDLEEGATLRRDREQANATSRYIRTIRFGKTGPAWRVDIAFLGRIRITRID